MTKQQILLLLWTISLFLIGCTDKEPAYRIAAAAGSDPFAVQSDTVISKSAVTAAPKAVTDTAVSEMTAESTADTAVSESADISSEIADTSVVTTSPELPSAALTVLSMTSPCQNGSTASVTIVGKPNTEYQIEVIYKTSKSTAKGLENHMSDSDGIVTWSWRIGANTSAGTHPIKISGGGETLEFSFETVPKQ